MRNKGFFWFFTILLLVVSLYQITFSFVSSNVKNKAEKLAVQKVEELQANTPKGDSAELPNGTYVNFTTEREAFAIAKSAYINQILKRKNNQEVFLGKTFTEVKNKSIALGLDLQGGMSVVLQLSIPDLVKNAALNERNLYFVKPFDAAMEQYNSEGGDFIDIFVKKHQEIYPDRPLIREFSTSQVISELGNHASDDAVKSYLLNLSEGALDGVETIMSNRINQFGVSQPNITQDKSEKRLYIELPGVKDQATVKSRLQSTANLEFYMAYKGKELGKFFNELLVEKASKNNNLEDLFSDTKDTLTIESDSLQIVKDTTNTDSILSGDSLSFDEELAQLESGAETTTEEDTASYQLTSFGQMFKVNIGPDNQYLNSPALGFSKAEDTAKIDKIINDHAEELMMDNIRFVWSAKGEKLTETDTLYYTLYGLKVPTDGKALVGGSDIINARVSIDPNTGSRGVSIDMNDRGTEAWGQMTSENVGNFIAICMDNKIFSAPVINEPITGGQTLISGDFTVKEATGLSDLLNAGALPAPCVIVDEAVVGPTIGAENSRTGLLSFGFALLLVLIYMVLYYGRAGLVADIALVINIVLLLGFLAAFGAVLTLSGIAGIVLTMGMSVDANVLIFERAREEIRGGKGMKMVIKQGYKNALPSIIDGQATTLLVGFILKIFGTGPIESFATTLIIGIFTSVFTAVVVSHLIFEIHLKKKKEFTFSTPPTKNVFRNANFKFLQNRKKFYILSSVIIIVGVIALFTRGLKPSVEFTGGRTYEMLFEKPVGNNIESLNKLLSDGLVQPNGENASVTAKSRNSAYRIEISTDYLRNVRKSEPQVRHDILQVLESSPQYGRPIVENSRSVSATVSEELASSAIIAIIFSFVIIFIYIFIRFKRWQFGLGVIVSTLHDVLIVLGVYALLHGFLSFNMEVDQAFIAAILTVVGYTVNDTVVVFDRIRENMEKHKTRELMPLMNNAINSTLGRTVNTSSTTFIVLLTIFIFDNGAISGFVFALMIGIVVGTYSSICCASPVVYDLIRKSESKRIKS